MISRPFVWPILAATLLAGIANAQALHPLPSKGLAWRTKPSGSDVARYAPSAAQHGGSSGWAVVECLTEADGRLKDCRILGEAPAGAKFGEAGLKLTRIFQLDITKLSPEDLAGGVVTMPFILNMNGGKPIPPRDDLAGEPSVLLAPAKNGVTPCPTATAPNQTCAAHRFSWAERPGIRETASFIRAAAASPANTALICPIDANMKLERCMQAGAADPSQLAAMRDLAPLFTAPAEADDKTSVSAGFVAIQFNWPSLKHAVETSVLTNPRP